MTLFGHRGVHFSGQAPRGLTWLLRPQRGLTHSAKATQYCRTKTHGEGDNHNTIYIQKYVVNVNKAINELKTEIFQRVQCLWNYMVVKASLRSYIVHHDQSGLSRPNHKRGKMGEYSQHNIYNVAKR
jgi:hypothetical protein